MNGAERLPRPSIHNHFPNMLKNTNYQFTTLATAAVLSACGGYTDAELAAPSAQTSRSVPLLAFATKAFTFTVGSTSWYKHVN